ncbi:MAG: hypothetical protein ACREDZ_17285 [Kiloniellales bacterium]
MSESITEVVGRFSERDSFQAAVETLQAAGFSEPDLSVLDTHETLAAAGTSGEAWRRTLAGLVGEIKFMGPIGAAGLIAISSGPIGATVAGLIAAGLSGAALAEALAEMRATPATEEFARALESGAILLWVRAEDLNRQERAEEILRRHGAEDVHRHTRKRAQSE